MQLIDSFFLRDDYSVSGRFIKDKRFGEKASPMARL